jgi:DNA ligase-1
MLAGKCTDVRKLTYPVLATPKLDGIRCLVVEGRAVSRKFKPIPNTHIRKKIQALGIEGLDGEIMIEGRNFNELSGDVRREDGTPNFTYAVFDHVNDFAGLKEPYAHRMVRLTRMDLPEWCQKIIPQQFGEPEALSDYEKECLEQGFEGVMIRSPNGPYKCGRSTENEGYLLKLKRFEDEEATVVDYEEEMENQNVATKDAFGRTERSSHKENLVGKGTLGKLVCKSTYWPQEFGIGTGFDAALRSKLWANRPSLIGKIVKFKYQPTVGADRPRFPVFLGFRDEWDM